MQPGQEAGSALRAVVSALGTGLEDRVDERFGRAAYLLLVDAASLTVDEAMDNTANRNALQGSGIGAAEMVAECGAKAVITGHLGPKAFRALGVAGIAGFDGSGMTVREAVEAWAAGKLPTLGEGEAHSGL